MLQNHIQNLFLIYALSNQMSIIADSRIFYALVTHLHYETASVSDTVHESPLINGILSQLHFSAFHLFSKRFWIE